MKASITTIRYLDPFFLTVLQDRDVWTLQNRYKMGWAYFNFADRSNNCAILLLSVCCIFSLIRAAKVYEIFNASYPCHPDGIPSHVF